MKTATKVLLGVFVALLVCNFALAGYFSRLKYEFHQHAVGESTILVSGVRLDGTLWRAQPGICHVVRITKDDCPYCRSDKGSYEKFSHAARQASCEIVELAPRAGEMGESARAGITQLKYIDLDMGPSIFPLVTPMTFVLDGNWKVLWMRRGTFSAAALDRGIQALKAPRD